MAGAFGEGDNGHRERENERHRQAPLRKTLASARPVAERARRPADPRTREPTHTRSPDCLSHFCASRNIPWI